MSRLIEFFTHRELKKRISKLERDVREIRRALTGGDLERRILELLTDQKTTGDLASELRKSRSWISHLLNDLEERGEVEEVGRRGREILYRRVVS